MLAKISCLYFSQAPNGLNTNGETEAGTMDPFWERCHRTGSTAAVTEPRSETCAPPVRSFGKGVTSELWDQDLLLMEGIRLLPHFQESRRWSADRASVQPLLSPAQIFRQGCPLSPASAKPNIKLQTLDTWDSTEQ